MKLIPKSIIDNLKGDYSYSIWIRDEVNYTGRYAIQDAIDLKLLFKLRTIIGRLYIQSEMPKVLWYCEFEHDKLYEQFVDKKK